MTEVRRLKTEICRAKRVNTLSSVLCHLSSDAPVMSDDHSELVPLLPIPNRTVKRLCADDSVQPYVKVGHRQTPYKVKRPTLKGGALCFAGLGMAVTQWQHLNFGFYCVMHFLALL